MPAWIMSHEQKGRGEFHYFIGAVKIVEFQFMSYAGKWKVVARYHGDTAVFDDMSSAMKDMHQRLKSPPKESVNASENTNADA